ncbi:IclR family transcriptional regulator [Brevirhabdus pacifica]|nr:IclR family transcriptional regulator [Brevirhabdus pacifica]
MLIFVQMAHISVHMLTKPTDYIASLAKGLKVIEAFGADTPRLSIAEAAAASGFDRATARRVLLTLHREGYADYDGKFFTLTPRILRLGIATLASMPLSRMVQPWLDQLTEQIGQSCSVAILDLREIVYIARAAQTRVMSIGLMPGSRLPAHCTSLGRVLLAALPRDEAQSIIETSDLAPRTRFSLTEPGEVMARIAKAGEDGFAIIDQEVELGLRSVAVPLFDRHGKVVAALNTGLAASQMEVPEMVSQLLPALLRVQSGLRRVL